MSLHVSQIGGIGISGKSKSLDLLPSPYLHMVEIISLSEFATLSTQKSPVLIS